MNINKFFKPLLSALMVVTATMFTVACSSSSDGDALVTAPPLPPVTPGGTTTITGIWDGTFTWETTGQSKNYEVTMLFHTPDGAEEGTSGGIAFGDGPDDPDVPHFLFEGGYQYFADPVVSDELNDKSTVSCEGDVWAVGRFGQRGTFIQEFSYITGSAAGPDQRGSGCLYLEDADGDGYVNELTGEIQFEDVGKFTVVLTYSEDNARNVTVDDLTVLGSDEGTVDVEYHLWSNDNSGNYMRYTSVDLPDGSVYLAVVEDDDPIVCGGFIVAKQVAEQNLFTLQTANDIPISVGCNVVPPNTPLPGNIGIAKDVALPYYGLGAMFDLDEDGNLEFIHLMASKGVEGVTSQAQYNQFIVTQ